VKTEKIKYISAKMSEDEYNSSKINKVKVPINGLVKAMLVNYNELPTKYKKTCIEWAIKNTRSGGRNVELTSEQKLVFDKVEKAFDLTSKSDNDRAALRGALRKTLNKVVSKVGEKVTVSLSLIRK